MTSLWRTFDKNRFRQWMKLLSKPENLHGVCLDPKNLASHRRTRSLGLAAVVRSFNDRKETGFLTPVSRVTVAVLEINLDHRVAFRQGLIDEGVFPPTP